MNSSHTFPHSLRTTASSQLPPVADNPGMVSQRFEATQGSHFDLDLARTDDIPGLILMMLEPPSERMLHEMNSTWQEAQEMNLRRARADSPGFSPPPPVCLITPRHGAGRPGSVWARLV
ncbi:hypothetical protein EYF80_028928 [Liparis tanakae]|uniref:Uncharacterized protein n=1 Tax=Liparis tanakae TaxID=230148 RepID=A0A4Z2H5C6_9TELE|nr:hypothetical protein EYF80_028928 [Liparis tanakae]